VSGPRVLAVVAEPPQIAPGIASTLSVMIANAPDASTVFRACASFNGFISGAQFGEEQSDEGCGGGMAVPLGAGEQVSLPGELTRSLFDNLSLAETLLGASLPAGTIDAIRSDVGLAFVVEATVTTQARTIRAVKRVLISEQATPHKNPPRPHFRFNGREIVARSDAAFSCSPADGEGLQVDPSQDVSLEPIVPGDTEDWLETYEVIDATGVRSERHEVAFYSWFVSGGRVEHGVTRAPARATLWHAPAERGCGRLWLVVRDGHGGESACGLDVALGEASECDSHD